MKASGMSRQMSATARVCRFGLTAASTKDTGAAIRQMVVAASFMQTEMFMKGNGKTIRHMASANTIILTELAMKVIGVKTSSMVTEKKPGQMELATKVNTKTVKRTGMANSTGPMDQPIKDNLLTTTFMESVFTLGQMADNIMVTG